MYLLINALTLKNFRYIVAMLSRLLKSVMAQLPQSLHDEDYTPMAPQIIFLGILFLVFVAVLYY